MENVFRGEIYLAKFGKRVKTEDGKDTSVQYGFRPVLIDQNNKGNASSTTVIVAPMTSKLDKPSLPTHVLPRLIVAYVGILSSLWSNSPLLTNSGLLSELAFLMKIP